MQEITIYEVGPRDGFQNQKSYIPAEHKLDIIDALVKSGITHLQVTSFMSPKAIPQMVDSSQVAEYCVRHYPNLTLSALVPNMHGAVNAWNSGLRRIFYVASLSETHNLNNIRRTHEKSMEEFRNIRKEYPDFNITLDLATAFGCPFEGKTSADTLLKFLASYVEAGINEVDLCDTIGIANPRQVREVIKLVRREFPSLPLQIHIHDTRNMGMVNTLAAIESGITTVQSTLGGLGGCPFAPGASGNLSTEDLVFMLNSMGYRTGIDTDSILSAARLERALLQEGNFSGHRINITADQCI